MSRAGCFAWAGANGGVVVVQIVTLAHEFWRNASAASAGTTMLLLVVNLALAGWWVGHAQEADR